MMRRAMTVALTHAKAIRKDITPPRTRVKFCSSCLGLATRSSWNQQLMLFQSRNLSTTIGISGKEEPVTLTKALDANIVEYIQSIQETGNVAVLFSDAPPVLCAVDLLCAIKDLPGIQVN